MMLDNLWVSKVLANATSKRKVETRAFVSTHRTRDQFTSDEGEALAQELYTHLHEPQLSVLN